MISLRQNGPNSYVIRIRMRTRGPAVFCTGGGKKKRWKIKGTIIYTYLINIY